VSKRSPTNARYQKYQEPEGKTRKSAAAAKPSRKSASTTSSSSSAKSKSGSAKSSGRLDPQTAEFKALRKQWWIMLLAGVVLVAVSWLIGYVEPAKSFLGGYRFTAGSFSTTYSQLISTVMLGLAYSCIFFALYLDFAKMRPMRQAAAKGDASAAKPTKKDTTS